MTCGLLPIQGWPLNKIKNNKERPTKYYYSVANGHLIELAASQRYQIITNSIRISKNWDFENWPLHTGPLHFDCICYLFLKNHATLTSHLQPAHKSLKSISKKGTYSALDWKKEKNTAEDECMKTASSNHK